MVRTGIQRSLLSPVSRLGSALVELLGYAFAARLSPTRCALAEGEQILFHGFKYFGLITLASRGFRVLSCGSSGEPAVSSTFLWFFWRACGVCAFLASSVSHDAATPPLLPTVTVYLS